MSVSILFKILENADGFLFLIGSQKFFQSCKNISTLACWKKNIT